MRLLDIVEFISRDSLTLRNRKAAGDDAIHAIFEAKKDKLIIRSASENVFYVKTSGDAEVDKKGKSILDITAFSGFNFKAKDVTIEDTGSKLKISCGSLKSIIEARTDSTEIEDALPESEPETDISLPISGLKKAIDHVIFTSYDNDVEASLPFSLTTTKKGLVYGCSNDHYCTSLHKIKDFKGKLKLDSMRTIPCGILDKIIRSTIHKDISFGFGEDSFTLITNDITVTYPQPEYDALADVLNAMKQWGDAKPLLAFTVNPSDLCDKIDEVGSVRDDDDVRIDLTVKDKKLLLKVSGTRGEAKSHVKVSDIKGKEKSISVVWNVFSAFVAQMSGIVDETCIVSRRQNLLFIETENKNTIYTFPLITDDYEG